MSVDELSPAVLKLANVIANGASRIEMNDILSNRTARMASLKIRFKATEADIGVALDYIASLRGR